MKRFSRRAIYALQKLFRIGLQFIGSAVRLLAASARTSPADDELSSSIRGGALNYRTGKFDDGTDFAGIYKLD
jgi:hypothetical protein